MEVNQIDSELSEFDVETNSRANTDESMDAAEARSNEGTD